MHWSRAAKSVERPAQSANSPSTETQGPSTPQIVASRRSAAVGMTEFGVDMKIRTQANISLERDLPSDQY